MTEEGMQPTREATAGTVVGTPTIAEVVIPMIEEALSVIEEATAVIEGATTAVVTVGDSTTTMSEVGTEAGPGGNDQRDNSEVEQRLPYQLLGHRSQLLPAQKVYKGRQVEQPQVFSSSRTLL